MKPRYKKGKLLLMLALSLGFAANAQNINTPNKKGPLGSEVNTYSGNLFVPRTDMSVEARGFNLSLSFYYNSFNYNQNRGFGNGWGFGYCINYKNDTANGKTILWGDGREDSYTALSGGGYKAPRGFFNTLTQYQANKFLLTELDGTKYFFDNSVHKKVTRVQNPNGNFINFNYTDSLLTSIVNNAGQSISFTYDAAGRLSTAIDAIAAPSRTFTYTYDGNNNLTQVTDPLGGTNKYTYLVNGPMKTLADKNNNTLDIIYYSNFSLSELIGCNKRQSFSYDTTAKVTVVTDYVPTGTNQVTTYGYQKFNELVWLTSLKSNCCGFNMNFEFDENGNKTKETDANGNATTYTYDNVGNVLTVKDALNQTMSYTYTANFNNIASLTDTKGNVVTLTYNSTGNLLQLVEPGNQVYLATYNSNGDLISSTDPRGNNFTYNYDSYGNPASVTGPNGYNAALGFDARGNLVSFTDAKGNISTLEYDILSRFKKVTDPLNNNVRLTYDAQGNIVSLINQNNETKQFKYDASNRVVRFVDQVNNKTDISYDAMDNTLSIKNALGNTMNFSYDSRNRLTGAKDALGNTSNINYDGKGNILSINLPNGQQVSYTYDQLDRITSVSDISGPVASFVYDKNNNLISYTNGTGAVSTATYDSLDRVKQVTDPLGNQSVFAYDKNGNVTSFTDRNGFVRTFTYDGLNRVKTYSDNNGAIVTVGYDAAGKAISMKDQNNNTTGYQYDNLNRLVKTTYPDGKYLQYSYDAKGNVVTKRMTDGTSISYVYDSLNRIINKILPDGQSSVFTYDALDRVVTATNNAGTVTFAYDGLDRITAEAFDGRITRYSYDIAGRKQTTIYPDSTIIYKTYDTRNRLTGIAKGNNPIVTYQYNNADQVTVKTFANGVSTNLQYDFANRLSNFSTGSIQNSSFLYDKQGNKNSVNRLNSPALSEEFTYDNNYRVTGYKRGVIGGATSIHNTYSYDALGNRSSANLNSVNTMYTSNNLNQIINSNNGIQNITFTYDNNGNLTYDGTFYKKYDAEGRLLKDSSSPSNVINYVYDAFNRRVQKIYNGIPLKYTYSGLAQIEERDGITNDLKTRTIFNNFITPVANEKNGSAYYYHQNELNSVEAITNGSGSLTERYQYDLYGKQTIYNGSNSIIPSSIAGNRFGFTGQEFDSATNSNRFHFRNYNPETGIFNQRDLIGYEDGTGMYQYVHNNPANGIDIFGLDDCEGPTVWVNVNITETSAGWVNGLGSWTDIFYKQKLFMDLEQQILKDKFARDILKKQGLIGEAIAAEKSMIKNLENLKTLAASGEGSGGLAYASEAGRVSKFASGLGKLGFGLNVLDAGIKTGKFGAALYDYHKGTGDGYQATKAGGNLAQSALGFTPVGALYNLADFTQEKLITGKSMNDNAEEYGTVMGDNERHMEEEEEAQRHREMGDFAKWWKIRKAQDLKAAMRNRKPNCPQNGPVGGTLKPPPGPFGPIIAAILEILQAFDPNEIIGPDGEPTKRWVSVNDRLPYTILYENARSASAPAKYVRVTSAIEPKQDPSTFQLGTFGFNNQTFSVPPNTASYYQRLNCVDSLGMYVDVTAGYDQINNVAFWEFQSIDPVTLLPPADPLKGFLLQQDSLQKNYGHGFVNFSIKPVATAVTLDTIGAKAAIVFDQNDTIPTNIAMNTIDAFAPASHMNALPANSTNPVSLTWGGADDVNGCGLKYYTLYVSTDGINFNIIRSGITRTDTTFVGAVNTMYYFFVLATDSVGNTERLRGGEVKSTYIGAILPVTWLYFKGSNQNKDNLLEWATASEQDSKEFRLERSLNAATFTQIATVAAAGNSSVITKYQYADRDIDKLNSPVMYYRLKQVDKNGNFKYSNVVRLNYNQSSIVNSIVYPNPTEGMITITVGDKSLIGTVAMLYDDSGKLLESLKITANSITMNLGKYVNGIYLIRLSNKETLKVIKN